MRKGQATRERITARAAELFNTRGYGSTVIADVMAAVELEKGGIYRHFASKDDLALAAFDYGAGIVRQRVSVAVAGAAASSDQLLAVVEVFRSYSANPPLPGGCPILNTAVESDDFHPRLRERTQAVMVELQTLLETIIRQGIERGELRPATDAARLATVIIATLEGAVMMSRLLDDPNPLHWAADHLHTHIHTQVKLN
ncbi:MAG: TetR/AcrR family transcriptional regulator [Oscillochloris sp.]|nr:TetR/AcrR family transcriptional regulator [Oscillochloris sp.]